MLPDAERLCADLAESMRQGLHPDTALVGIHTGGVWVAGRLHAALGLKTPLGSIDVSFYRDDFSRSGLHPQPKTSDIPFAVEDRPIVIVDDVLYTGRTVRAVINELYDFGRPASVTLAVLVDRGGRELPIEAAYAASRIVLAAGQKLTLVRDDAGRFTFAVRERSAAGAAGAAGEGR